MSTGLLRDRVLVTSGLRQHLIALLVAGDFYQQLAPDVPFLAPTVRFYGIVQGDNVFYLDSELAEIFGASSRALNLVLHAAAGIVIAVVAVELMPRAAGADPAWRSCWGAPFTSPCSGRSNGCRAASAARAAPGRG